MFLTFGKINKEFIHNIAYNTTINLFLYKLTGIIKKKIIKKIIHDEMITFQIFDE